MKELVQLRNKDFITHITNSLHYVIEHSHTPLQHVSLVGTPLPDIFIGQALPDTPRFSTQQVVSTTIVPLVLLVQLKKALVIQPELPENPLPSQVKVRLVSIQQPPPKQDPSRQDKVIVTVPLVGQKQDEEDDELEEELLEDEDELNPDECDEEEDE